MFGIEGEEYSRDLSENARLHKVRAEEDANVVEQNKEYWDRKHYRREWWRTSLNLADADYRLKKMMTMGQKEALQLNEEYNRLKKRVEKTQEDATEALASLSDFEREKLGMKDVMRVESVESEEGETKE